MLILFTSWPAAWPTRSSRMRPGPQRLRVSAHMRILIASASISERIWICGIAAAVTIDAISHTWKSTHRTFTRDEDNNGSMSKGWLWTCNIIICTLHSHATIAQQAAQTLCFDTVLWTWYDLMRCTTPHRHEKSLGMTTSTVFSSRIQHHPVVKLWAIIFTHNMSCQVTPSHAIPFHSMSCNTTPHLRMPLHTTPRHTTPRDAARHHTTGHRTAPHGTTPMMMIIIIMII